MKSVFIESYLFSVKGEKSRWYHNCLLHPGIVLPEGPSLCGLCPGAPWLRRWASAAGTDKFKVPADKMDLSDFRFLLLNLCGKNHPSRTGTQSDCHSSVQLSLQSGSDAGIKLLLPDPPPHPVHPELGICPLLPWDAVAVPGIPGTDALRFHVPPGAAARPDELASESWLVSSTLLCRFSIINSSSFFFHNIIYYIIRCAGSL